MAYGWIFCFHLFKWKALFSFAYSIVWYGIRCNFIENVFGNKRKQVQLNIKRFSKTLYTWQIITIQINSATLETTHGWIIDHHQLAVDRYLIFSQMPFFILIIRPVTIHIIFWINSDFRVGIHIWGSQLAQKIQNVLPFGIYFCQWKFLFI